MSDSTTRDQLLKAIQDLSARFPHWRFGQLVANVAGWADAELWDVEDKELLEAIEKQRQYHIQAG